MSATAWKCRCAKLEMEWLRRTPRRPSGDYNDCYTCAAKDFFMSMLGGGALAKVGGWVADCRNVVCSKYKFGHGCTAEDKNKNGWCDQCIWYGNNDISRKCVGDVDLCPFFRERTATEWMRLAMRDEVPLLGRKGQVKAEARAAKRHFKISDKAFAKLVEEKRKYDKEAAEMVKAVR